jgi:hypothetical protein
VASVTDGVTFVASSVRDHTATDTVTVSLNGVVSSPSTATFSALTQSNVFIGALYDGTQPFVGAIACVLAYSGAHDAGTRKKIERWLGQQYGVAVAQ